MEPENATSRALLSRDLLYSGQYERLVAVGFEEFRVYALMRLDRSGEPPRGYNRIAYPEGRRRVGAGGFFLGGQ